MTTQNLVAQNATITTQTVDPIITTTVTFPGSITSTAGDLVATAGSVSAGTTVTGGTGVIATTGNITADVGDLVATGGNVVATSGTVSGASLTLGAQSAGVSAVMVAGKITVNSLLVTDNSVILLTRVSTGGSIGYIYVSIITPNESFEIRSTSATETSTVYWTIVLQ